MIENKNWFFYKRTSCIIDRRIWSDKMAWTLQYISKLEVKGTSKVKRRNDINIRDQPFPHQRF